LVENESVKDERFLLQKLMLLLLALTSQTSEIGRLSITKGKKGSAEVTSESSDTTTVFERGHQQLAGPERRKCK
jgi:hypothetical protein